VTLVPLKGTDEWPVIPPDAALVTAPRASAKRLAMYVECGKRGAYEAGAIQQIVAIHVDTCQAAGLDPLLVVSQLVLETDNLTSEFARLPRLDPVGIVPPRERGKGRWFASWAEAARAHAGLLLAYALPKGAETGLQRTLVEQAVRWRPVPGGLRGSAPTLDQLPGAWSAEQEYAERIRRIANTILEPQW
jgi:hypothetical protein